MGFLSISDAAVVESGDSVTKSVTVPAGSNKLMVVCSGIRSDSDRTITGITFNGTEALTLACRDVHGTVTPFWRTEIWYLVNPTSTTADVVVSYSGVSGTGLAVSIALFDGMKQTGLPDAIASANGASTTLATTITTIAANAIIIDSAIGRDDGGLTVGAGQTQRTNRLIGLNVEGVGISTVVKVSPGVEVMDWTQGNGALDWVIVAASFAPVTGGVSYQNNLVGKFGTLLEGKL